MSDPRRPQAWNLDPVGDPRITPGQAHRAALAVVARFPEDPLVAAHILEMLGLLPETGWPR